MAEAGAGHIGNYDGCSFFTEGTGTFKAGKGANPHVGAIGELHREPEAKLEMVVPGEAVGAVRQAMLAAHPYEEVAYDRVVLENGRVVVSAQAWWGSCPSPWRGSLC